MAARCARPAPRGPLEVGRTGRVGSGLRAVHYFRAEGRGDGRRRRAGIRGSPLPRSRESGADRGGTPTRGARQGHCRTRAGVSPAGLAHLPGRRVDRQAIDDTAVEGVRRVREAPAEPLGRLLLQEVRCGGAVPEPRREAPLRAPARRRSHLDRDRRRARLAPRSAAARAADPGGGQRTDATPRGTVCHGPCRTAAGRNAWRHGPRPGQRRPGRP